MIICKQSLVNLSWQNKWIGYSMNKLCVCLFSPTVKQGYTFCNINNQWILIPIKLQSKLQMILTKSFIKIIHKFKLLKEIHSYILRRSQLMLRYCNTCNIIIEKGGNFVKSVSLDEKRRWSYMFTIHTINYWKFRYLWLDEQCLVPLFMVILYIQTSSKGLC